MSATLSTSKPHRIAQVLVVALLAATCGGPVCSTVMAQATGSDAFRKQFSVGAALYNARKFKEAQAPFEEALQLAESDKDRVKVHEALLQSYRQLSKPDKFIESCEFIIEKADQPAKRSLTRRALLGFMFSRGKDDDLVKRYEKRLKKQPKDWLSLYILADAYSRTRRDPQRGAEIQELLLAVEKESGKSDGTVDVREQQKLAMQYSRGRQYEKAAELYAKIAPHDEALAAWNWKEAALAWYRVGKKDQALEAAKKSTECKPEARNDLLARMWHEGLGQVFLDCDQPKLAVPHFEAALEKANADITKKTLQEKLLVAKGKAGG